VRLFPRPARPAYCRRSILSLQPLEGRVVPAGSITASVSALGVLTVTGDDSANGVTLKVTPAGVTLTSDGTTSINGLTNPVTLPAIKSIKADLKGGDDTLSIDSTSGFAVTGLVGITLGDGDNTLNLTTTGKIELGALIVKGGDGADTVTVQGGVSAGSVVKGAASFGYANGGSNTTLADVQFALGAKVTAGDAGGSSNDLTATTVTGKIFTVDLGNSFPGIASFADCTLGGLNVRGFNAATILQSTTINGSVIVKGSYQSDLQLDTATVTGSVTMTDVNPNLEALGGGSTINGNLTITGSGWATASFESDTLSEVKGNITVTGGWYNDLFQSNGAFKVGKTVSLTLNGGDNLVAIGDGSAAVVIGGSLRIKGGAGADTISLDGVTVTGVVPLSGAVSILTFAGNDILSIDGGSSFAKTFTADLGTGNDTVSVAQKVGASAPVTFTGTAKILAGIGDDTLILGLKQGAPGGDANSRAVFNGLSNVLDGGTGVDQYDATTAEFTGVVPVGW
jgi:hypothetical protein